MKKFLKQFLLLFVLLWVGQLFTQAQTADTPDTKTEVEIVEEEELPAVFKEFSFLKDLVDVKDCEGQTIDVYTLVDSQFVIVKKDDKSIMYDRQGKQYCADTYEYNCLEFYKFNNHNDSWTCED